MARTTPDSSSSRLCFGEFELDEANALLLRDGNAIDLAPTPFKLLCALANRPGSLLTKHALLDEVWGHRFVSDSVLKGAISDIRSALGDDPRQPRFIQTVARRGYRFVAGPTAVQVGIPLKTAGSNLAQRQSPSFIGRAAELARLRRAWDHASGGKRTVVWIAGESGIGKTTLIEHFVAGLGDITRAHGQCVEHYGTGEPYLPVLEALAEMCRSDVSATSLLREVAPTWLLQLPWLSTAEQREALLRELVGVTPERMLREMGEFLDRYTEQRPLLLITEDLHWGDRATIQLIDFIARRRGSGHLMWLSSFRLAEIVASDHPLSALRHELRLHDLCEEIVLDAFSESEVAAYLADRAPSLAVEENLVRALYERTDGVPLFIASVTRDVIMQGTQVELPDGDVARLAASTVPDNLAAFIDHYIARLDHERRGLLAAAAVCGVEFRTDMLSRVLDCNVVRVAQVCDELAHEQVWLAAPRTQAIGDPLESPYSFRHGLFREVLYGRTPPALRAGLHSKVGTALEAQRAAGRSIAATELAMHFDRGREPMAALRYYVEAAEAALYRSSPGECATLTERALSLLDRAPEGAERTSLEISLTTLRGISTFHVLGAGDEARAAFLRASSLLGDVPLHPMRGLLLHGLGFLLNLRAEYAEALATAHRAEALDAGTGDPLLQLAACTVQGQAYMLQGRPRAARASLERALPAIESANTASGQSFIGFIADPQVTVLAMLSLQLAHLGLVDQAREHLQQAHARARQLAQPMALMVTLWFDALVEVRLGDAGRLAALAQEMTALVDEFALAQGRPACRFFRGRADAGRGNALEGFREIRAAYEENTALGMISGGSETLGYAAEALLLHGDLEGAREQLEQAFAIANACGERIYLPQLLLIEGAIADACGEPGAAETSVRRAIDEARAQGTPWLELLALTRLCERAAVTDQDRSALSALVAQLGDPAETATLANARALLAAARQA